MKKKKVGKVVKVRTKLRLKSRVLVILSILCVLLILISLLLYYVISLSPVSNDKNYTSFKVNSGDASSVVIDNLKKEGLIRSSFVAKIYLKLHKNSMQAGSYRLSKSLSTIEILNIIKDGKVNKDSISVTFVEGKRLTYYAKIISDNFSYSYEDVINRLDDKDFIKVLINKYDFLTDSILDDKIYHPLEGYLFPDTYEFNKDESLDNIVYKILDNTKYKLDSVKGSSNFNVHEIITLASIIELEGAGTSDRAGIAGVFINRLNKGITLGSDVTTYYAVNKDFTSDLRVSELNSCNGYNTRGECVLGLPVGPICSPGLESIKAVYNPDINNYLFFVADKNGKVYYSYTSSEHDSIISKLKQEGLWFVY